MIVTVGFQQRFETHAKVAGGFPRIVAVLYQHRQPVMGCSLPGEGNIYIRGSFRSVDDSAR
jgi:hypothetical protein